MLHILWSKMKSDSDMERYFVTLFNSSFQKLVQKLISVNWICFLFFSFILFCYWFCLLMSSFLRGDCKITYILDFSMYFLETKVTKLWKTFIFTIMHKNIFYCLTSFILSLRLAMDLTAIFSVLLVWRAGPLDLGSRKPAVPRSPRVNSHTPKQLHANSAFVGQLPRKHINFCQSFSLFPLLHEIY